MLRYYFKHTHILKINLLFHHTQFTKNFIKPPFKKTRQNVSYLPLDMTIYSSYFEKDQMKFKIGSV